MIGNIIGEVLFSDGHEAIIMTSSGIGYQVFCHQVLSEGGSISLFITHVIKEASEELYGFITLREKKMFELLTSVKGVGPKSAYNLLSAIGVEQIINAIVFENKKILTSAPGVGNKAASQMLLDLCGKVQKINMYSNNALKSKLADNSDFPSQEIYNQQKKVGVFIDEKKMINDHTIINEALMACNELGFKDEQIIPLAQKIMNENFVSRSEQLVHLVLKEL